MIHFACVLLFALRNKLVISIAHISKYNSLHRSAAQRGGRPTQDTILCQTCMENLDAHAFDSTKLQRWRKHKNIHRYAKCLVCEAKEAPIRCVDCKKHLAAENFDRDKVAMWKRNKDLNRKAVCSGCDAKRPVRRQVRAKVQWKLSEYTCSKCSNKLPPHKFDKSMLARLENQNQLYLAMCGSCSSENLEYEDMNAKPVTCNLCKVQKPRCEFSLARRRLRGDYARWRCIECDFPACIVCGVIPSQPKQTPFTCNACSFPPCRCGAPRPQAGKYHISKRKEWECAKCKADKEELQ